MKSFLYSTFLILHFSFAFVCLHAKADPSYWLVGYTSKYSADNDAGSEASKASYFGYYCTVEKAAELFEGSSASAISSYLSNSYDNYTDAKGYGASDGVTAFDSVSYSDGEYAFLDYVGTGFSGADYVALAFYSSDSGNGFRVLTSSLLTPNGQVEITPGSGTGTSWYDAPEKPNVPEPTSGLLLLFGAAALALKRKRNKA